MFSTFLSILARNWEKALLLASFIVCLCLCTLAAHYFTFTEENLNSIGHKPVAVPIFPWNDRSFFHPSVPESAKANPFAHTFISRLKPPEPPKPPKVEPPKEKPTEPAAKTEQPKPDSQNASTQPKAQDTTPQPPTPPEPPKKPDIVFTICYRGFYVDVRGETLAMLTVTDQNKKETKLFYKKGMEICGKLTFQQADDTKATFTDAQGNVTDVAWNAKHTFTFKQE